MGLAGVALFQIMKVYTIMPMPGSQRMNSVDIAYVLYSNRWVFRLRFEFMVILGARQAFQIRHKWLPVLAVLPVAFIAYIFNFQMMADAMFKQPEKVTFKSRNENALNDSSIVIGVEYNGEVKAYPMRFITYH